MQIMAQKVDELLDGDHCSASRAGATNCQHRHSQLRREMSAIIPLHGLLTVGRWAWEYLKQHSFLFFFLRTHLRTEKVRTTTWTASPDINTNACIKSTYGNSLTFYEDDFLELELSFFFLFRGQDSAHKEKDLRILFASDVPHGSVPQQRLVLPPFTSETQEGVLGGHF